ncbi:MAG TPA: peptidoglycan-binding domain-containing protein [Candidatus Sulfotelmatobacter sp.]|nr:peptidoglycan-binding domain-containing protein [Candidatus Sulfotelmatobacter sp.]
MRRETWTLAAGLLALTALGAAPAAAQVPAAPLTCSPANLGQTVCQAEGRCRCSYNAGGTMLRDPPGYHWDCSLLLGTCSPGSVYPVLSGPMPVAPQGGVAARPSSGQIRAAQSALKGLGYDPGPIDGVMGPRTARAASAFQRSQGLPGSGQLTPETLARLRVAG